MSNGYTLILRDEIWLVQLDKGCSRPATKYEVDLWEKLAAARLALRSCELDEGDVTNTAYEALEKIGR